jgi:hypothetical protein
MALRTIERVGYLLTPAHHPAQNVRPTWGYYLAMNIKKLVLVSSMMLGLSACCGGGKKTEPSRWQPPATTTAKGTTGTTPSKPTATSTATAPAKDEPKPVEAGVLNKYFPADGVDGAKRTFKADKPGYAEAKYVTADKKELTLTINDLAGKADERGKFKSATDKISGNPVKTFGKNKSQMLVNDRFQVDVMSMQVDEAGRKPWLSKFNLSGLSSVKLFLESLSEGELIMSEKPLYQLLEDLPQSGITVTVLNALDYIVPGSWQNITSFEEMIRATTGEDDQEIIQAVGMKAQELYADPDNGYQRAVWIYGMVDSVDKVAGAAALANKVADKWSFGLLSKITPKADNAQAVDASLKFAAELATFCLINGIPGDSVGDFASSLLDNSKEDIMRIAAWLAIDLIIPLGPDAIGMMMDGVKKISSGEFANNPMFKQLARFLPGNSINEQKALVEANIEASAGFLTNFQQEHNMDQGTLLETVRRYVDIADDKLDYVAAILDMSTNYFEHTGIQTTTRRLITRAYSSL